ERISLESFNNSVAPLFVGLTAELVAADGSPRQIAAAAGAEEPKSGGLPSAATRVLIVGGGSSHDFDQWFKQEDSKTLSAGGKATVKYTNKPEEILPALKDLDALYLSNNQPMKDAALRKAIFDFADAGKGLLLVHPALWYNWPNWPEYNRVLCGGGSRGHDGLAEFEVTITDPSHPLVQGLPQKFTVRDELYWFQADPQGTPIKILATAQS